MKYVMTNPFPFQHWELKTWSKLEQSIHLKFHVSLRGSEERSNFQYWTRQSSWFLTTSPLENWSRSSDVVSNSIQPRHSSSWSMTPISPQSLCQCQNYTGFIFVIPFCTFYQIFLHFQKRNGPGWLPLPGLRFSGNIWLRFSTIDV